MRADAIRTARVPARLAGAPRLRQVLERWLADSDLTRHGFPPRAIILVRRFRARWGDIAGDDRVARYEELAALLGQARRPATGETGEVVWFEDEAELLACMARDALSGALGTHWWWRVLLGGAAPRDAAVARWLDAPRVVPRALRRLDPPSARAWIASWAPRDQVGLLRRLAQAFPIAPQVAAYVEDAVLPPDAVTAAGPASVQARAAGAAGVAPVERHTASRAERLHRLCADLAQDASAAAEARHAPRMASRLASVGPSAPPAAPAETVTVTVAPPERASPFTTPAAPDADRVAARNRPTAPASSIARPALTPPVEPAPGDAFPSTAHPPREHRAETPRPAPPDAGRSRQEVTGAAEAVAARPSPAAFDTRHGGLLFLLNAALQLSLYGDFTRPLERGLPCTPWRFLLIAGRLWCGPAFRADPLAEWLTGRAAETRAAPDSADDDWRVPAPWLTPFAETAGVWRALWRDGRVRLVHPAGFTVLQAAATPAQCGTLLDAEMARLGIVPRPPVESVVVSRSRPFTVRPRTAGHRHGCPNAIWPYLRARLALALGLAGHARAKRRLAGAMLRLPARLHDGGDRVDLHLPLDTLPLAVRLAGLDRDPGWIPAAGCDFRFHFH